MSIHRLTEMHKSNFKSFLHVACLQHKSIYVPLALAEGGKGKGLAYSLSLPFFSTSCFPLEIWVWFLPCVSLCFYDVRGRLVSTMISL